MLADLSTGTSGPLCTSVRLVLVTLGGHEPPGDQKPGHRIAVRQQRHGMHRAAPGAPTLPRPMPSLTIPVLTRSKDP